ncbi:MAG: MBOAT family O-acyltransferase [Mycobacterium leprae]
MLFHSPEFIILMALTLGLYLLFPKGRMPLLAVANLFFYGVSGWKYMLLFMAIVAVTHFCALRLDGAYRKLFLVAGLLVNVANLVIFKYTAFAVENLDRLFHMGLNPKDWQLLLPIGISFYTFHLIAYLVDVYKGIVKPARSYLECWVYTAFFGQLIAGPIMRGPQLLPQLQRVESTEVRWGQFRYGAYLFLMGMAKKVLFSDVLSPRVENFFTSWSTLSGPETWIAGWLFAFQIYFDFSAYSEMALGIGHMFGLTLVTNFRTPYLSQNPTEFWKRWHISLSSWIRDYIYIPLGGSRAGEFLTYFNLIAAMAISGLWHGAAWTFIIWGLYHGFLSAGHRFWTKGVMRRLGWQAKGWAWRWIGVFAMFQATTVGWIFFRAGSLHAALHMVYAMFSPTWFHWTPLALRYLPVIALLFLAHVAEFWLRERESELGKVWDRWFPIPVRSLLFTLAFCFLLVMTQTEQVSFIYFRF